LTLCQALALTSENDFGTLYRPGFAGLKAGCALEERCEGGRDGFGGAVGLEGEEGVAQGQAFACLKAGFALE